ncbi:unnamed protein product [Meloidogyne enterolobii]|uniref:Uncharacterized protein n=1 Tax=Meloidogyne enterolobii TaxID=390850 RepID=A0ACB0XKJ6_MELEN
MRLELLIGIFIIIFVSNGHAGRVRFESKISTPNKAIRGNGYLNPKTKQQIPKKSAMKMRKFTQSFNHVSTPNGHEMEYSMQHEVYNPKPRSKPKPKTALVQEPAPSQPAPVPQQQETVKPPQSTPWDKNELIEHVIAAYKNSCKSSDIVIFSPEEKHKLISSIKKMPLVANNFTWVMNVEMFCTLNFWRVHSCFNMPLEGGFKTALATNGIEFNDNSGAHGSVCALIRKFESDELKESRTLAKDELKDNLAHILLDEFHKSRSLPHPSEPFLIAFPLKGANVAYWTLATKIEQFNTHLSKQASDFCTAFHSEQQLFDHFEKFTAGTEKTKLDDAFRNLTNVMNSIPLVKAAGKEGSEENCTYDLFLFRAELEFFLALDNAIINWLAQYGTHDHEYFCPEWRRHCLYEKIRQRIREIKKITEGLIKNLHGWFDGRTHGRINEDFDHFVKNYVAERFRINIPAPPKPEPMRVKVKYEQGGYKNKMIYEHDGRNKMRMITKVAHSNPKIGTKKFTNEMYMPKAAFANPNNFSFNHQYNHGVQQDMSEEGDDNEMMYKPKSAYKNPNKFSFKHEYNHGPHNDMSEELGEGDEHEGSEQNEGEHGMDIDASDEGGMHTNMEMSHEFDQHPYGDMQDTSIEMGHEEIMDKNGKKRNAINYRCRVGANEMSYQFGYDPACAA